MRAIILCIYLSSFFSILTGSTEFVKKNETAPAWEEVTLTFISETSYENPYMDVEMHAIFLHDNGTSIIRPAFWDGGETWKIRFASPLSKGTWKYVTTCSDMLNSGLHNQSGELKATSGKSNNPLLAKGFLRMSPKKRNIIHANGHPFVLAGDTPWALPFRGTPESVKEYASDRQQKGFNAALMMTIMPDMKATGPRDRFSPGGFDVAFEDLPAGHITKMNIAYFQYYDELIDILLDHGIVPVYQPVFHGFGWKGLNTLGRVINPQEYVRYNRYLVARYGARPAIWLVCGDGDGNNPGVKEAGEEIEKWDAYQQPTGLHYHPGDQTCNQHQDQPWLDFQWCQTGHGAQHDTKKVKTMYNNLPAKAVANGEPTYEAIGMDPDRGAGWWQGNEAWLQFTSGGTMGHVYGAAGLWNWKLMPDEPGWPDWANGKGLSWKEALKLEGSVYVGIFRQILSNYNITDIELSHDLSDGKNLLSRTGELYICYLPDGGKVNIKDPQKALPYRWYNPKSGEIMEQGKVKGNVFISPVEGPAVLIIGKPLK